MKLLNDDIMGASAETRPPFRACDEYKCVCTNLRRQEK